MKKLPLKKKSNKFYLVLDRESGFFLGTAYAVHTLALFGKKKDVLKGCG